MSLTIKDIAKIADVSIATVSRVINNKAEGISEETRQRVLQIVKEHNYTPNRIARSMITKNTRTIGLIIPDIRNPFFTELVRGVEDVANRFQYTVFLCNGDKEVHKTIEYLNLMKENSADGVLLTVSDQIMGKPFQQAVEQLDMPVVLIDRGHQSLKFSGVYIDNVKAGYKAVNYLISLSHTEIGCIAGPKEIKNSHDRLQGYLEALKTAGIPVNPEYIVHSNFEMEEGYQAAKQLLTRHQVTAIFALNDLIAFGVYQAAEELGLRIPDDLSVVGFDDLEYNRLLSPKLTTIRQPIYEIGETAAEILLKQIQGRRRARVETYMEIELVVRGSTARFQK
ncbi:LacI family DNA-binding transcriptional regulator [Paenibacillus sp. J2TS4]|uniref:LacI family DNA-binding transcriptional regulator n=1 Tax=Paenibacillus sp. J2TS4 TaxID=2807194 RepID=UPI001B28F054|nr:LacI family DNA-binding transcriptional regulator [Paenibacillus sp. J2TS4]GIP31968.1 LacI family transcriptional regulator [Paenibacillus sp. J2TS4]